jgi:hypothetical protein
MATLHEDVQTAPRACLSQNFLVTRSTTMFQVPTWRSDNPWTQLNSTSKTCLALRTLLLSIFTQVIGEG